MAAVMCCGALAARGAASLQGLRPRTRHASRPSFRRSGGRAAPCGARADGTKRMRFIEAKEAPDGVIFRFGDDGAPAAPRIPAAQPAPAPAATVSEAQSQALTMVASAAADSASAWAAALEAAVADGAASVAMAEAQRQPLDKALSAVSRLEALLGTSSATLPRPAPSAPRLAVEVAQAPGGTQVLRARTRLDVLQEGARSATPLVLALAAADAFFAALKSEKQLERERVAAAQRAAAAEARAAAAAAAAAANPAPPPTPAQLSRGALASAAFLGLAIAMAASFVSSEVVAEAVVMAVAGGAAFFKATFAAAQRNASANAAAAAEQAAEQQAAQAAQAAQQQPVPITVQSGDAPTAQQ